MSVIITILQIKVCGPHLKNSAPFQNPLHAGFKCRFMSRQSLWIPFDQHFHAELSGYWFLKDLCDLGSYFNVPGLCFLIHNSQIRIVKLELFFGSHTQAYLEDTVQLVPDHHNKYHNKASHTNCLASQCVQKLGLHYTIVSCAIALWQKKQNKTKQTKKTTMCMP